MFLPLAIASALLAFTLVLLAGLPLVGRAVDHQLSARVHPPAMDLKSRAAFVPNVQRAPLDLGPDPLVWPSQRGEDVPYVDKLHWPSSHWTDGVWGPDKRAQATPPPQPTPAPKPRPPSVVPPAQARTPEPEPEPERSAARPPMPKPIRDPEREPVSPAERSGALSVDSLLPDLPEAPSERSSSQSRAAILAAAGAGREPKPRPPPVTQPKVRTRPPAPTAQKPMNREQMVAMIQEQGLTQAMRHLGQSSGLTIEEVVEILSRGKR